METFSFVKSLFLYNRTSFKLNKNMLQEGQYHLQKMKNKEFDLYREDIRMLFELTLSKMEIYLFVSAITLLIALALVYEGQLPSEKTPSWLFYVWASSASTAIFYLFMSKWFAIHACVEALNVLTWFLTKKLRLPVPSIQEINKAAVEIEEFEKENITENLRVPFIQVGEKIDCGISKKKYTEHFKLYEELFPSWQGYDVYCRVSLVLGTNQFVQAMIYTGIGYFGANPNVVSAYWGIIAVLFTFQGVHVYMNLLIPMKHFAVYAGLLAGNIFSAGFTNAFYRYDNPKNAGFVILVIFCMTTQLSSLGYLIFLALDVGDDFVPRRFSTVQLTDIFERVDLDPDSLDEETHRKQTLPYRSFEFLSIVFLLQLLFGIVYFILVTAGVVSYAWSDEVSQISHH
jgi:hypothetical protein